MTKRQKQQAEENRIRIENSLFLANAFPRRYRTAADAIEYKNAVRVGMKGYAKCQFEERFVVI